jgi:dipeptidyl aminopeptidase/acylaminoacyl peptidase
MSKNWVRLTVLVFLIPIIPALVLARVAKISDRGLLTLETSVTCYDTKFEKVVGSRFLRSPVFVSPDGQYRAFTENVAKAFRPPSRGILGYADAPCANTSRLYVSGPTDGRFRLALLLEPLLDELGNSIQIIDWSPDSRYLLLMTESWQYEADSGSRGIRVLDAFSGVLTGKEPFRLEKPSGSSCSWDGIALGFSPDGKIVARVLPTFDAYGDKPDYDSCVKKPELHALDLLTGHSSPLRDDFRVDHYGKWQEQVSKKDPNEH